MHIMHIPSRGSCWKSRLFGGSFGFAVAAHLHVGQLHIGSICGKAVAHALDSLLIVGFLLLQRPDHVLHLALVCQEALHTALKALDLYPRSLSTKTDKAIRTISNMTANC